MIYLKNGGYIKKFKFIILLLVVTFIMTGCTKELSDVERLEQAREKMKMLENYKITLINKTTLEANEMELESTIYTLGIIDEKNKTSKLNCQFEFSSRSDKEEMEMYTKIDNK